MEKWKTCGTAFLILSLVQIARILFVWFAQILGPESFGWNRVYNGIFMLLAVGLLIGYVWMKKDNLCFLPVVWKPAYLAGTVLAGLFLCTTPFITQNTSMENLAFLAESALILPVFEELLFRGLLWKRLEFAGGKKAAFWISACLFGLWHIGYVDTILYRMSWAGREGNIAEILFWKVMTGFLLGLLFGWMRQKFKNGLPGLLAHIVLNTMG